MGNGVGMGVGLGAKEDIVIFPKTRTKQITMRPTGMLNIRIRRFEKRGGGGGTGAGGTTGITGGSSMCIFYYNCAHEV
jgi:hypothetical protein